MKTIPCFSILNQQKFDYTDVYFQNIKTNKEIRPEDLGKAFFTSNIPWIKKLFTLRNKLVSVVGLKGSDKKSKIMQKAEHSDFAVGERFGLFKVIDKKDKEIILGEDDKHLDFKVSLLYAEPENKIYISTGVQYHNFFGRLYFFIVKPFHRMVVKSMLNSMVTSFA
ncbi:hypothetical protein BAX94_01505 [Elizabethkingia meningoseptica]|uniref:DUF2867 domain-containing protein n=1 Tax=Elizabethkingia meningoseptica TaxID=238 RepID=A0A1T3FHB9_ELIME|nr:MULTISPECIES: DUF2867 domain-containing protein [Elizabethkingia]AQX12623.1 hypothetical protein BBD35_09670 [Elizabethkingia meningoseptica]MBG0514176.1 DUF2867 domain-containing protein [Elizabethkingia meningoseptica]MDE5433093.1 DUF2867 domain-containing protein [Elizabethkingia meningoseptica]MDE5448849.1 DUF2867 domain-containing protein [Elizabethkingia meningoseptica]MDE5471543.1 DUF2867 domain-containing protein [Elizabethkingia meningoseptica]